MLYARIKPTKLVSEIYILLTLYFNSSSIPICGRKVIGSFVLGGIFEGASFPLSRSFKWPQRRRQRDLQRRLLPFMLLSCMLPANRNDKIKKLHEFSWCHFEPGRQLVSSNKLPTPCHSFSGKIAYSICAASDFISLQIWTKTFGKCYGHCPRFL